MRYLIDEFKKAATLFTSYSRIMRPVTYTCFENAIQFTTRASNLELSISFTRVDDSDDIECHVAIKNVGDLGGTHDRVLSKYLKHEDDNIVKFAHQEINSIYAAIIGIQLIEYPESAPFLIELIDRSKQVITNFINEINDRELTRSHYQPEKDMSDNTGVTLVKINALLDAASKEYTHHNQRLTNAVVTLESGFMMTGESFCADPDMFDALKGEEYALDNVRNKLWELENYRHARDEFDKTVKSYQGG